MELKIQKVKTTAVLPRFAHATDGGMDIFSSEAVTIPAHSRLAVSTGIAMAIPSGYVGLLWDKSSIPFKHGVTTLAGVIDAGYRGEVKVILHNLTDTDFEIEQGQKIAQMLIQRVEHPTLVEVDNLDETARGDGGFGSTGEF